MKTTKTVITFAAVAFLTASGVAHADVANLTKAGDNVNGVAVVEQSERQALLDDGRIIINDGGKWYDNGVEVTIAHAVEAPHIDAPTHSEPVTPHLDAPADIDRSSHLDNNVPSQDKATHLDNNVDPQVKARHLDGTHSEPVTPHLDAPEHHETAPTKESTSEKQTTTPTTTPTSESKTNQRNTSAPVLPSNVTGSITPTTSNASKVAPKATTTASHDTPSSDHTNTIKPTITTTRRVAEARNELAAHSENGATAQVAQAKVKLADAKKAEATTFTGNTLPVTGSDNKISNIMTGFGILLIVWGALHTLWVMTAPRRKHNK